MTMTDQRLQVGIDHVEVYIADPHAWLDRPGEVQNVGEYKALKT